MEIAKFGLLARLLSKRATLVTREFTYRSYTSNQFTPLNVDELINPAPVNRLFAELFLKVADLSKS